MHQYMKNIVTLKLSKEKCVGCSMCIQVCPHNFLKLIENAAAFVMVRTPALSVALVR